MATYIYVHTLTQTDSFLPVIMLQDYSKIETCLGENHTEVDSYLRHEPWRVSGKATVEPVK